jgi:hypothetical protein
MPTCVFAGGVGFIGQLNKIATRTCITDSLTMLNRMEHRGACGCEANTGTSPLLVLALFCVYSRQWYDFVVWRCFVLCYVVPQSVPCAVLITFFEALVWLLVCV